MSVRVAYHHNKPTLEGTSILKSVENTNEIRALVCPTITKNMYVNNRESALE